VHDVSGVLMIGNSLSLSLSGMYCGITNLPEAESLYYLRRSGNNHLHGISTMVRPHRIDEPILLPTWLFEH